MTEKRCCGGTGHVENTCTTGTCNMESDHGTNTQTMCIIEELNRIYEDRLQDIDEHARGDLKLKNITYKEWVDMLLRLMHYLLQTLHDLENEASQRMGLLEKKLQVECRVSHTDEIGKVKSDLANLLELIRRAIDERKWNTEGLEFLTITEKDIFGSAAETCPLGEVEDSKKLSSQIICQNQIIKKLESDKNALKTELEMKELQLRKGNTSKCNKCKISKSSEPAAFAAPSDAEDKVFKACISELREVLNEKETQLADTLKENECLKSELSFVKGQVIQKEKVITNMKALTIEVADKHDQIQQMRTQIFSLEEELKKAEKKVQFKDNVIKELRRDCKNISKDCICSKKKESPRSTSSSPETVRYCEEEGKLCAALQSSRTSCSQVSTTSEYSMETVVAFQSLRLNATQAEEAERVKMLQKELDELFFFKSTYDHNVEDQRKIVACQQKRVQELIQQLLLDLHLSNNKLAYVRNQLLAISSPCDRDSAGSDSGYTSQEDMEPETTIIRNVRGKMLNLKDENANLKCQVQQLQSDIESAKSSASSCGKILHEVASAISSMRRKDITCDIEQITSGEDHKLREEVCNLECEFKEKNKKIQELKESHEALDTELQSTRSKICALNHETSAKDHTIFELQETISFQNNSIQLLQGMKKQLEGELAAFQTTTNSSEYKEVLQEKIKLESECQNLLTTISNLRQALESSKRSSGTGNTSSGGNSNSLWNWWRNGVHDV